MSILYASALIALIFFFAPLAKSSAISLNFGTDLKGESTYDYSLAEKFKPSSDIRIEVDSNIERSPQQIILVARLFNRSHREQEIIVFPVNGRNPFYAELQPSEQLKPLLPKNGEIPLPTQIPPPPMKIKMPAKSIVLFRSTIDLSKWQYSDEIVAKIKWSFNFWNEPKPQGILKIKLLPKDAN